MKNKFWPLILWIVISQACSKHPVNSKPPYILLVDHADIYKWPVGKRDTILTVSVALFNNTNDTLRYAYSWGRDSDFYYTDNKNLVIINNLYRIPRSIKVDTVAPHEIGGQEIFFRLKKVPDTTFSFKIGVKLLKLPNKHKTVDPDKKALENADIIWSDVENFKTDRKHQNYFKTQQEDKRHIEKILHTLTDSDRHHYVLSIDPRKIGPVKDTLIYFNDTTNYRPKGKKFCFAMVPLVLVNNSNQTLEYTTCSCSWNIMYQVDNKDVSILAPDALCFGNYPTTNIMSPRSPTVVNIPLIFDKNSQATRFKFRIGLTLLRAPVGYLQGFFEALPLFKRDPKYLIWSNEVEVHTGK